MDIIQEINEKIKKINESRSVNFRPGIKKDDQRLHGTTILALKYKRGVIMASDRRCTAGDTIFSDEMVKIEELGSLSCIAGAGMISDFQLLVKSLRDNLIPHYERYWDIELFIDGQAKLLEYIMENACLYVWPLLAGWDPCIKESRIFLLEADGAVFEPKHYTASGSGERNAMAILDGKWLKDCSQTQGVEIAVEAILASSKVDPNTSNPLINPPIIKCINSEKITTVSDESTFKLSWKRFLKDQARRGDSGGFVKFLFDGISKNIDPKKCDKKQRKGKK